MPTGRFLFNRSLLNPNFVVTLPPDIAHQVRDVLRLAPGARVRLLDGVGGEYSAEILTVDRKEVTAQVGERVEGLPQSHVHVTLCLGLLRATNFEWALQKGTELGVVTFQPLVTERSVAAVEEFGAAKRRRNERILAEALEQCGGSWLPTLAAPRTLADTLGSIPSGALALIPWEEESAAPLSKTLMDEANRRLGGSDVLTRDVWLFIGPAGGFSAGEVAMARDAGVFPVTLGPRILRAETAALVATTLALDALGALQTGAPR